MHDLRDTKKNGHMCYLLMVLLCCFFCEDIYLLSQISKHLPFKTQLKNHYVIMWLDLSNVLQIHKGSIFVWFIFIPNAKKTIWNQAMVKKYYLNDV